MTVRIEETTETGEPMDRLKGRDFEDLVAERFPAYKKRRLATFGRYGVQGSLIPDRTQPSGFLFQPIRSLPDFEGVLAVGRQVMFDTKVCSAASMTLAEYQWEGVKSGTKARQLKHMIDRSWFRVPCSFVIHWNYRSGATFEEQPETYLFPIGHDVLFWQQFARGEQKSINRKHCREYGQRINWNKMSRAERKLRPDVLDAIIRDMCERGLASNEF